jgi:hypothetical protein
MNGNMSGARILTEARSTAEPGLLLSLGFSIWAKRRRYKGIVELIETEILRERKREKGSDGEMERWRDGEMERWRDGEMERWRDSLHMGWGSLNRGYKRKGGLYSHGI